MLKHLGQRGVTGRLERVLVDRGVAAPAARTLVRGPTTSQTTMAARQGDERGGLGQPADGGVGSGEEAWGADESESESGRERAAR